MHLCGSIYISLTITRHVRSNGMTSFGKLTSGDDPPNEINVVVEIPSGSSVKYEVDRETGNVFVDRFLYSATHYPFNYGFVPRTREEDGDPIDVVVLTQLSVVPMTIIRSRPFGMLVTEDEKGRDVKIVAAPLERIDPYYAGVDDVSQLTQFTRNQIETFFKQYKELEPTKFVKIVGWEGKEKAKKKIMTAIRGYKTAGKARK